MPSSETPEEVGMQLEGGGTVAGSDFSYTCRTTGRIDYDLDDSQGQSGDVNHDRLVDLSDSVSVLQSLFLDGSMACPVAANVNGDTATDLSDVVFLLSFIFQGGPAPPSQPVTCSDT